MEPAQPYNEKQLPDTRKIVHRHLQNKEDVITDDDIASVRISKELPPFLSTTVGAEARIHAEEPSRDASVWNVREE